ncbi:hypothetical protein LP420_01295 [Massilia sp. B-10]|nr:hypothetical protein LP420_01295 [Massilia sp. B-10]
MAIRRITLADIVFGQPLPWDVFSTPSSTRPLLEKGKVAPPEQLERLLDSGLYAEAGGMPSILQHLNQVNRRLERILLTLRDQNSADRELRELACELLGIVERDQDVVLAAIFLNQIAGAYAVRHCTETAIVVCIIARHAQVGARSFARDGRRADHECGHGAPGRFIPQPRRRAHQRGTGRHPPPPFRQRRHAALG